MLPPHCDSLILKFKWDKPIYQSGQIWVHEQWDMQIYHFMTTIVHTISNNYGNQSSKRRTRTCKGQNCPEPLFYPKQKLNTTTRSILSSGIIYQKRKVPHVPVLSHWISACGCREPSPPSVTRSHHWEIAFICMSHQCSWFVQRLQDCPKSHKQIRAKQFRVEQIHFLFSTHFCLISEQFLSQNHHLEAPILIIVEAHFKIF